MTRQQTNIERFDGKIDREKIGPMLINLFDHWNFTTEEKLASLGLALNNRTALRKYKDGASMSSSRDSLDRAGNLLAIHKNLRLLFPENRELAYSWMKTPNRKFDGKTPAQIISEMGFSGLLYIRSYLDKARGH